MRKSLLVLLVSAILFIAVQGAYSASSGVSIQSINYPEKVHPNVQFSIATTVISNDVNGWAKVKLLVKGTEMKSSDGAWYGWGGIDAGKNTTLTLSGISLGPSRDPYSLEVATFWQPLGQGETKEESKTIRITAVTLTLRADCLPNSVNASQNFTLQCSITNGGNDIAYAVVASIANYGDFTPKGTLHEEIGNLPAGESKPVSFSMGSPTPIVGGEHSLTLELRCTNFAREEVVSSQQLTIKVEVSPSEAVTTWWPVVMIVALVIVIILFAVGAKRLIFRPGSVELRR
jgi:hypothetical protein